MENASKALIIAGAILLSILIIAIGMYIYNSSTNSINQAAGQISQQEISAFNSTFLMYEGKQVGANVKSLIQSMISNASENSEEDSKLPDLVCQATSASDTSHDVESVVSEDGTGINIAGFNSARTAIQSRHYYWVKCDLNAKSGLVETVTIYYNVEDGQNAE